jgi:hypothetical protein
VSIVIGVVAHQSRKETAQQLRRDVGGAVCSFDDGTLGCEGNHIQVLRALARRHVDWCVILEDDAIPCKDFRQRVKEALPFAPAPIVGLYLGTGNPSGAVQRTIGVAVRAAAEKNAAWITSDCLIGSVGYAVRIRLITPLLAEIVNRDEELPLRISRWAQAAEISICYTQPSLVNHTDGPPVGFTGGARSERRAWNFHPRTLRNWDTKAVQLGDCGMWSRQ